MDDRDAHDDIERLEKRIEALSESIERCRKIALVAKLAISAGAAWLVLMVLGFTSFLPAGFVLAAAALIGGIVLLGSNSSTWNEKEARRREADERREELIEELDLHLVGEQRRLH